MPIDATAQNIALLLWRAGFGATSEEVAFGQQRGYAAMVDTLLAFPNLPARPSGIPADPRNWWLQRMRSASPNGVGGVWALQEKLTLFWHGHFPSSLDVLNNGNAVMFVQNETLRALGAGKFLDLLAAIAHDPAMLMYLSNDENIAEAPNENWGRELQELFTLGIGNYSEADVKAAARAFTGWGVSGDQQRFEFHTDDHDTGAKTFLGVTGNLDGNDIVRLIAAPGNPGFAFTARFIARKLFRFFAYANPTDADLSPLVEAFTRTGGSIRETVRALFLSPAFLSDANRLSHVRSPVEYTVGITRTLASDATVITVEDLLYYCDVQGHALMYPPNVGGWPGGVAWLSTQTMIMRYNFAAQLAPPAAARYLTATTASSWQQAMATLAARLTLDLRLETQGKILTLLGAGPPQQGDDRLALLVQLVLLTPEMLVA